VRRIHAELKARGIACSRNTVAKRMHENGVRAKATRKFRNMTDSNHPLPVAENLLDRQLDALGPNEHWRADMTYIPIREGWLYLAVVEDTIRLVVSGRWDRRPAGRPLRPAGRRSHQTASTGPRRRPVLAAGGGLVVDALEMAVARRLSGLLRPGQPVGQRARPATPW
jgi:transposase InsO family protein